MSRFFALLALVMLVGCCQYDQPPSNFSSDAFQVGSNFYIKGVVESIGTVERVEGADWFHSGTIVTHKSIRLRTANRIYNFEPSYGSTPNFNSLQVGDYVQLNVTDNDFYIGSWLPDECTILLPVTKNP